MPSARSDIATLVLRRSPKIFCSVYPGMVCRNPPQKITSENMAYIILCGQIVNLFHAGIPLTDATLLCKKCLPFMRIKIIFSDSKTDL